MVETNWQLNVTMLKISHKRSKCILRISPDFCGILLVLFNVKTNGCAFWASSREAENLECNVKIFQDEDSNWHENINAVLEFIVLKWTELASLIDESCPLFQCFAPGLQFKNGFHSSTFKLLFYLQELASYDFMKFNLNPFHLKATLHGA